MKAPKIHLDMFPLVASGMTNRSAGKIVGRTESQVGHVIEQMLKQTGTKSRSELVAWAYAHGILKSGVWPPALSDRFVASSGRRPARQGK